MGCGTVGSPTDVHRGKRRTVAPPDRRLTVGRGVALLLPSLCLPWADNKAGVTGVVLSMRGVAPHTTPVRAHPASLGTNCAASRCAGVGPLVLRGPHVGRRLERGGGSHSGSPLGWGGAIPPASGGGVAPRPPCSRPGRRPAVPLSGSLRVAGALSVSLARAVGAEVPPRGGGG